MKTIEITKAQERVLACLEKLTHRFGYPPTIREMTTNLGKKSPQSIRKHLVTLRECGIIKWLDKKSRSITIVAGVKVGQKQKECAKCGAI